MSRGSRQRWLGKEGGVEGEVLLRLDDCGRCCECGCDRLRVLEDDGEDESSQEQEY